MYNQINMKVQIQRRNPNEFNSIDITSNEKSKVIKYMFDNDKNKPNFRNNNSNSKSYNPEVFFAVPKQSKDFKKDNFSLMINEMIDHKESSPFRASKPTDIISSAKREIRRDFKYDQQNPKENNSVNKSTGVLGFITNFLGFGVGKEQKPRSTVKIPFHPINRSQDNVSNNQFIINNRKIPVNINSNPDNTPNITNIKKDSSKRIISNESTKSTENLFNNTASHNLYKLKKSTISSSISINPFKSKISTKKNDLNSIHNSLTPNAKVKSRDNDNKNVFFNENDDPKNSSIKSKSSNNCILFIPCMNCGNTIHIEEIEEHSNKCVEVKKDIVVAETSKYTYNTIDYKLRKLHDHVENIRNLNSQMKLKSEFSREMHHFHTLGQLLSDSISLAQINNSTLANLKKLLLNLDVSTILLNN